MVQVVTDMIIARVARLGKLLSEYHWIEMHHFNQVKTWSILLPIIVIVVHNKLEPSSAVIVQPCK